MWNVRKISGIAVCLFLVTACGSPKSESTNVPNAGQNPSDKPTTTDTLPVPTNTNSGLPNLTNSFIVTLIDSITYTGLELFAQEPVVAPVVGDVRSKLILTAGTNFSLDGKFRLFFEDKLGAWWADIPSVKGTGSSQASQFDMIFSDDLTSVRVAGTRSGDDVTAGLYFRNRMPGENQCRPIVAQTCRVTYNYVSNGQTYSYTYEVPFSSGLCTYTPTDYATPCQAYLNPATNPSSVKLLGTVKFKYSQTLSAEGN